MGFDGAIRSAAAAVHIDAPDLGQPTLDLRWGDQVDVKLINPADLDGEGDQLTEQKVAGYVAKYATKAAETAGTLDRRVRSHDLIHLRDKGASDHAARLIRTAWTLGDPVTHPELLDLKLRKWAHMLGFRGHFSTRSRAYRQRLPIRQGQRARIIEFVFRALKVTLPAGHPGGVAINDPVAHALLHDADQHGQAVLHRRATAPIRDPAVDHTVNGTVGDQSHRKVPEIRDNALTPPCQVRIEGLALQTAQGQRHHPLAVLGKSRGCRGGVNSSPRGTLHDLDPGLGSFGSFSRLGL